MIPALDDSRAPLDSARAGSNPTTDPDPIGSAVTPGGTPRAQVPSWERLKHVSEKYLVLEDNSLAQPKLGGGSFGDVLLCWKVLPRLEGESAVLWQARCREGPQLALKRIRPTPPLISPKLRAATGGLMGMVRAKSRFLSLASKRALEKAEVKKAAEDAAAGAAAAALAAEPPPGVAGGGAAAEAAAPAALPPGHIKKLREGGMFNSSKTRLRDRAAVRQEAEILQLLSANGGSPHVVKLLDHVEDERHVYLVMELVQGGDLTKWLKRHQKGLTEKTVAAIFLQLLKGVQYCHTHNVCHRDLKLENTLVFDLGANPPQVCLCDFGLAALLSHRDEVMTDVVGSAYFLSPELLAQRYTSTCDVWSLGVNLYLLLCGSVPFGARAERTRDVHRAILESPMATDSPGWAALSPLAKDLLMGLLEKDPSRRYTLKEALAHRWFQDTAGTVDSSISPAVISSMMSFVQSNKFRAKALGIVADCLTAREAAQLREQFFKLDLNSDLNLSQAELGTALEKLGLKVAGEQLSEFMASIDSDGSGTINLQEFLAATAELSLKQHKQSAMRAFARFDLNGDGLVSFEEAKLALGVEDEEGLAQLRDLLQQYNTTEASGSLTFEDFLKFLGLNDEI